MVTDCIVQEAAGAVRTAMDGGGGLVIAAGAGMGVDSGLALEFGCSALSRLSRKATPLGFILACVLRSRP